MANADGDVKLSVGLTTKDVQKGARAVRKDIADIFKAAEGQDVSNQFQKLQERMSKVAGQSRQLSKDMQDLGNKQIPTEEYKEIQTQIDRDTQALNKLNDRMQKFVDLGGKTDSKAYKSMQYDATELENSIRYTEGEMQSLVNEGKAFTLGSSTEEFARMKDKQAELMNNMTVMVNKAYELEPGLRQADSAEQQMQQEFSGIEGALLRILQTVSQIPSRLKELPADIFKTLANGAKNLASMLAKGAVHAAKLTANLAKMAARAIFNKITNGVKNLVSNLKKATSASNGLSKSFNLKKLLMYVVGIRSLFFAIRRLRNGIKEGIKNLAQWRDGNNDTNKAVSQLVSSLNYLKNSWGAAFAPIIQIVAPILSKLMDMLAKAGQLVGAFFAALGGKKTVAVAVKNQTNYAASLNKSTKATKDNTKALEDQLGHYDELNVITRDNDTSSNSGSDSSEDISPNAMFQEVNVGSILPESVQNWIDNLKQAWRDADWYGVGNVLAEGLNSAMLVADNWINTVFHPMGVMWAERIALILNGLVDNVDWALLGKTTADGLNSVFDIINTFLTTFDFEKLGRGIGTAIKSWFDNVDWALIGQTFANKWNALINTVYGIVTTPGIWTSMGSSIATFINNFFSQVDWTKLVNTVTTSINGVFTTIRTLLTNIDFSAAGKEFGNRLIQLFTDIDWAGVGQTISLAVEGLLEFLVSIDWVSLGMSIGQAIGDMITNIDWLKILTLIGTLILELVAGAFALLTTALGEVFSGIGDWFAGIGEDGIAGLFKGIGDALKSVGSWLKENIVDPIVNGVKDLFGIHSPSTVFSDIGGNLIDGLLDGISGVWGTITEFFSTALDGLKSKLSGAWDSIKSTASTVWSNLKEGVSEKFNSAKSALINTATSIGSNLSSKWTTIKSAASTAWTNVKSSVTTAFNSAKDTVFTTASNISSRMSTTWNTVRTTASTAWSNLKTTVSTHFTNLKSNLTTTASNIGSTISGKWDSIKSTASTKWSTLKSTVSSLWNNVHSLLKNKDFTSIGSNLVSGIRSGLSGSWGTLTSAATSLASSLTSTIRNVFKIKSPSRVWAEIGEMLDAGLVKGMESEETTLTNEAEDLAKLSTNALEDSLTGNQFTNSLENVILNLDDIITKLTSIDNIINSMQSLTTLGLQIPNVANGGTIPSQISSIAASNDSNSTEMRGIENYNSSKAPIVLQLDGRTVAEVVWDENEKRYKQSRNPQFAY